MIKRSITVDFSKKTGKIKPVNGINNGPCFGMELETDCTNEYKEMACPIVRVADVEAPYASSRYLDLHCIFPDMSLDHRFEASYNFGPTDRYLAAVKDAGADVYLRLGESREPYEIKSRTFPPESYEKIALICERIIAHYNKGWANGYKYNIKYVEIFSDVDTTDGWNSSGEEYFELYSVVASHLKSVYPKLKVGAYSSGGFCSLNHYDSTDKEKNYLTFVDNFLTHVAKKSKAPLDFFSWKCYADSPEEVSLHANYARSYLGQYGFRKTQSVISEFNLADTKPSMSYFERSYPARLARALITAQKSDVDIMFFAHANPHSEWNSLYAPEGRSGKRYYSAYHVMTAFGALSTLSNVVDTTNDYRHEIYSLAVVGDDKGAFVFATENYSGLVEISIKNSEFKTYSIKGVIGGGDKGAGFIIEDKGLPLRDGQINLKIGKNEVYFLAFSK